MDLTAFKAEAWLMMLDFPYLENDRIMFHIFSKPRTTGEALLRPMWRLKREILRNTK